MSSQPQEHETITVTLDHEERWVIHHVLTTRADEEIDERDTPPTWLLALVETIEADDETLTYLQARNLYEVLSAYADAEDTPERDTAPAAAVTAELETALEAI
ncbi:DUF7853 family protein [Natronobiforma cellulositropha]|uniref:DUF7853 family protein n=1 Tax=Natronobiforma cellulositropha TaxID=1679076 RepID=UPI0021D600A2|nr:hypothetical protein [Natronobiforma cellulositropha]